VTAMSADIIQSTQVHGDHVHAHGPGGETAFKAAKFYTSETPDRMAAVGLFIKAALKGHSQSRVIIAWWLGIWGVGLVALYVMARGLDHATRSQTKPREYLYAE